MKSREELVKEVEALRRKLSPLEDKEFTKKFIEDSRDVDFMSFARTFRGVRSLVVSPVELWERVYATAPNKHQVMVLGRTLQALMWERSALNGERVFVKTVEEFENE